MSRIIRFPLERRRSDVVAMYVPSPEADFHCEPQRLREVSDASVVYQALAIIAEARAEGLDTLPDIAWVIRTSMPSLRRRGKAWSSLPQLHRDLLERHVEAGDPTATVFKAWIVGRHIPSASADRKERRHDV
jgi:hypothetical protein